MKRFLFSLFGALLLLNSLVAADGIIRDGGTLRMTWSEFKNMNKDCGNFVLKEGYYTVDSGDEWNKIKVRFSVTNKTKDEVKIRYVIAVFDKTQNLVFAGSEDKGIAGNSTEQTETKAKISAKLPFDPEVVYLRIWSESN